jgi:hypothetical protein
VVLLSFRPIAEKEFLIAGVTIAGAFGAVALMSWWRSKLATPKVSRMD